jgi:hypothetical protein
LNLDIIVKIAKSQYGNAGKYMAIFDVNKPMLRNPNKRVQSFLLQGGYHEASEDLE